MDKILKSNIVHKTSKKYGKHLQAGREKVRVTGFGH